MSTPFLSSRWSKAAVWLIVVGWVPLLVIVVLGEVGILHDPNPVGPGLLAMLTFWPALICGFIGLRKTWFAKDE